MMVKLMSEAYVNINDELEIKRQTRLHKLTQMYRIDRQKESIAIASDVIEQDLLAFMMKTTEKNRMF